MAAMIITGVLFALVGGLTFARLAYGLDRAEASTAQLIRVQKIQSNLLSADATATNTFLVGGLEPEAQRVRYDQAVTTTSALIAEAADAQPADAEALAVLNQAVVQYVSTMEAARANNRQGFPVGSQYLRNASAHLRSDALPVLDNLNVANAGRASTQMDTSVRYGVYVLGLAALAATVATMVWVARRFKRTINPGLLAASIVWLVALVACLIGLTRVASTTADIKSTSLSTVTAAANARTQANNAKSNESLTLIARGSGASFEDAWSAASAAVTDYVAPLPATDLSPLWDRYAGVHRQIRALDDGGSWDKAVRLAIGTADSSSNATPGVKSLPRLPPENAKPVAAGEDAPSGGDGTRRTIGLVVGGILVFLAGLAAAVLARWGLSVRLKEYR